MSNVYLGTAINFGVAGTTITGSAVGTFIMQDFQHEPTADVDEVRDENGALVQETYYNFGDSATFSYVPKGTGLANAITQSTVPTLGAIINVTGCTQYPPLVATTWRVKQSPTYKATNTSKSMVTLKLVKHAGITAASSA